MEKAIHKAIEKGFVPKDIREGYTKYHVYENMGLIEFSYGTYENGKPISTMITYYEHLLINPLFWQCLAKAEGWTKYDEEKDKTIVKAGGIPRNTNGISSNIGYYTLRQWHKLIDHIADGGNVDDFFNNLLK